MTVLLVGTFQHLIVLEPLLNDVGVVESNVTWVGHPILVTKIVELLWEILDVVLSAEVFHRWCARPLLLYLNVGAPDGHISASEISASLSIREGKKMMNSFLFRKDS